MIRARAAGDAAVLLELADGRPAALAAAVTAAALPGVLDAIPAARTVLVTVQPGSWELAELARRLTGLTLPDRPPAGAVPAAEIAVCYDGPDLADVAAQTGLAVHEIIARHQAAEYEVGWLGFAPGFAYLTGLDPALQAVPRLASPRLMVPAGSVAIAGGLAAVYPASSPGGWRLIGRTNARLWDPARGSPALLEPGMRVRFRAVPGITAASVPRRLAESSDSHGEPVGRSVQIVQPGPLSTVQDLGRPRHGHLGVPHSGAADSASLRDANALVRNEAGLACLEVTLGRLAMRFDCDAVAAVTGAPVPLRLTGPGGSQSVPPPGRAFGVTAGSLLRLGSPRAGLRSYLAVDGGFDVRPVLGSRSADLLSGLGPPPLQAGQRLPLGPASFDRPWPAGREARAGAAAGGGGAVAGGGTAGSGTATGEAAGSGTASSETASSGAASSGRTSSAEGPGQPPAGAGPPPAPGDVAELRVIAGPRDDWFTADALATLASASYQVTAASDRTGLRLAGPPLRRAAPAELPSEGLATGSLQVSHDGQPILLLADHPVTGGYPVIAVVRAADIGLAAQLRPGQQVRFSLG